MENKSKQIKKAVKRKLYIPHWKVISALLVLFDIVAVNLSFFLALWLRFDCTISKIPEFYLHTYLIFAPVYAVICVLVFAFLKLYNTIWRFANYNELVRTVFATVITGLCQILGTVIILAHTPVPHWRMPISYYLTGLMLQFLSVFGIRFAYRFTLVVKTQLIKPSSGDRKNVMLIGAGAAGQMLLRDLQKYENNNDRVCCIIDDNENKWNRFVEGVPVVGGRDDILASCKKYNIDKIYLAIPSTTAEQKRDILSICNETGCELKSLPGIYQLVNGEVTVASMKNVAIEDLLGRDPISADLNEVFTFIQGKKILVTGGGGSIGSELCRQIASHNPKQLIIFDVYENNAYDIQLELKNKYPNLNLVTLIGSVRDSRKINQVFEEYKPDVVYHAAAHKHVPLMEDSPCEAIKNNAIGTYKTAYAAILHGCNRFVLISTDKAVNPTNIMGASKRLCEMIIQSFAKKIKEGKAYELPNMFTHADEYGEGSDTAGFPTDIKTEFVAVRFGNVLGSNGSVIPLFKRQIENGGPVTVTHPDIIRYFMTIPEAVSLVLQAGTYAHGGEIFVLDMGSPVKIDTLARNLIKLSGYKPDVDIKIEYTGLRPGEKLYEEKLMAEEGKRKTNNDLIHIGNPIPFDVDSFLEQLQDLMIIAYMNSDNIRNLVAQIVTTYHPENNETVDDVEESKDNDLDLVRV
ncbi:MAG: polysaccharide biosynthesis protein [Ruminococcus sp.]|nr:polysaccharide biosynthesis protein [Ruminococcus sp.]